MNPTNNQSKRAIKKLIKATRKNIRVMKKFLRASGRNALFEGATSPGVVKTAAKVSAKAVGGVFKILGGIILAIIVFFLVILAL